MQILSIWLSFPLCLNEVISMSCGIDKSPVTHVYEGIAKIETYPWLGVLYYQHRKKRFTTAVVLVTRQIVLAAANEVDKLPKYNFRARARVVIGQNCKRRYIGVRDYTYHPDFSKNTYSTLAMIQLETDHTTMVLQPICPPPTHFKDQNFYAMVLSDNCKRSKVSIHKMKYVSPEQCKMFYRRSGLDVDTLWPSHTACARSVRKGHCVWRSGAILVVKVGIRWRLLGFSVYGPGCQAPARFLDYGMYHEWVQRSVERIGRPAITTLADNHVVLRRTLSNVQRFGPCDSEETNRELYSDNLIITPIYGIIKYNLTIVADVEYSCIVFKAESGSVSGGTPKIRLRRWCAGAVDMCFGLGFIEIKFYVEIIFQHRVNFQMTAHGREVKFIDPSLVLRYLKDGHDYQYPVIESFYETRQAYMTLLNDTDYPAFGRKSNE